MLQTEGALQIQSYNEKIWSQNTNAHFSGGVCVQGYQRRACSARRRAALSSASCCTWWKTSASLRSVTLSTLPSSAMCAVFYSRLFLIKSLRCKQYPQRCSPPQCAPSPALGPCLLSNERLRSQNTNSHFI